MRTAFPFLLLLDNFKEYSFSQYGYIPNNIHLQQPFLNIKSTYFILPKKKSCACLCIHRVVRWFMIRRSINQKVLPCLVPVFASYWVQVCGYNRSINRLWNKCYWIFQFNQRLIIIKNITWISISIGNARIWVTCNNGPGLCDQCVLFMSLYTNIELLHAEHNMCARTKHKEISFQ